MKRSDDTNWAFDGLCFHIFGEEGKVRFQGIVRCMVNADHAIVQYFEWGMGELNTLEVVAIASMATGHSRAPGSWQFYESVEHMNEWCEDNQPGCDA